MSNRRSADTPTNHALIAAMSEDNSLVVRMNKARQAYTEAQDRFILAETLQDRIKVLGEIDQAETLFKELKRHWENQGRKV